MSYQITKSESSTTKINAIQKQVNGGDKQPEKEPDYIKAYD
ncbi:hypothetical protein BACINT_03812 [Bacteroides intestinalis DSM 17393]|uniref:Uncharacterized protein n=1 Tax=Bacteroides intestinalis DSM 17393 TaxID=471870 RepID=B3CCG4_9BACE|nr:hypothetical protein BACINT_03812 [Bacteroides intestinalis DSM 17393]